MSLKRLFGNKLEEIPLISGGTLVKAPLPAASEEGAFVEFGEKSAVDRMAFSRTDRGVMITNVVLRSDVRLNSDRDAELAVRSMCVEEKLSMLRPVRSVSNCGISYLFNTNPQYIIEVLTNDGHLSPDDSLEAKAAYASTLAHE